MTTRAIYAYLTGVQKGKLVHDFGLSGEVQLYNEIQRDDRILKVASGMLGVRHVNYEKSINGLNTNKWKKSKAFKKFGYSGGR